jgi:hypothetical protein
VLVPLMAGQHRALRGRNPDPQGRKTVGFVRRCITLLGLTSLALPASLVQVLEEHTHP